MRRTILIGTALAALLAAPGAGAHELWFQPTAEGARAVRLTFGDSPAPGEAERVAEIAHAKVWADGKPAEVERRPDGLEARFPWMPVIRSAYADRGVVDYMGDSFVIHLAAYAQYVPHAAGDSPGLGLGDDQLRLLLAFSSRGDGTPVVRATRLGQPVVGAPVKVFRGSAEAAELRTDARGEVPCPDLARGPVSLLAQVVDKTPGARDGKSYSHVRYKATLSLTRPPDPADPAIADRLARVKEFHGGAGPWAVVGYRMGERALKELGLPRQSSALTVVHKAPMQVQYTCMADGLQAATGASVGKLNLRLEEAPRAALATAVEDRKTGRRLTFTIDPSLAASITDLPFEKLDAEGRRVAALPDDALFRVAEGRAEGAKP